MRSYATETVDLECFQLFLQFVQISFYFCRVRVFHKGLLVNWLRFDSYYLMVPFFKEGLIRKTFVKRFMRNSINELLQPFVVFFVQFVLILAHKQRFVLQKLQKAKKSGVVTQLGL
jgi:hypothetical protein